MFTPTNLRRSKIAIRINTTFIICPNGAGIGRSVTQYAINPKTIKDTISINILFRLLLSLYCTIYKKLPQVLLMVVCLCKYLERVFSS